MSEENITFRINHAKKVALEAITAGMNRDRSYIINAAIDAYLEIYQWQIEEIQKGIAEADAENFASEEEVTETFTRLIKVN